MEHAMTGDHRQIVEDIAHIAQLVEHFLGKEEVIGSIPIVGSTFGFLARLCPCPYI
jgi:hypothetical protein